MFKVAIAEKLSGRFVIRNRARVVKRRPQKNAPKVLPDRGASYAHPEPHAGGFTPVGQMR